MSLVGRWVSIQCFKHNGSTHRWWDRGLVLENNNDYIVVATKRAKVVESNGRCWFTKEPAVTIFSKKEWWNTICMFKKDGICYYCNIASPSIIEDMTIKYIDYDLDAKLFPNQDIRILDEKEYEKHKSLYQYSDELDHVLKYQMNDILEKMKNKQYPFNNQVVDDYFKDFLSLLEKNQK